MDLAAQEINIKDIVIQDSFKASPPSTYKIAKCYGYYRKNKVFDRDIIINKDNVLTDGYDWDFTKLSTVTYHAFL